MQRVPWASNEPNHLGLCALQSNGMVLCPSNDAHDKFLEAIDYGFVPAVPQTSETGQQRLPASGALTIIPCCYLAACSCVVLCCRTPFFVDKSAGRGASPNMEVDPHQWCSGAPPMGVDSSIGVQTLCLANSPSPGLNVVFFLATGVVQDGESNPPGTALDLRSRCFVVKTLRRTNLVLDLPGTTTVAALKAKIADAEGVPVAKQRLLLGGRDVMDGQTLAAARIMADSTLELVLRLRGGMPKQGESSVTSGALQALVCTCTMVGG